MEMYLHPHAVSSPSSVHAAMSISSSFFVTGAFPFLFFPVVRYSLSMTTLFFDIGSTLVDESTAYDHHARMMLEGSGITFAEFDRKRREFYKKGMDGNSEAASFFRLREKPWPSEDETLFPDAFGTLEYLEKRGYRLGIIANQPRGTERRLSERGLLRFFSIIEASYECGFSKPDERIFLKALEEAGCEREEAWMIGDRLDNDIAAAHRLGMKTVWIRSGMWKLTPFSFSDGIADFCINQLSELKFHF